MLRAFGSELTSLINSDPAWKVSKGSRSASRKARRTFGKSLKNCAGVLYRSSQGSDMPVSESEKHGLSVLGCRFTNKVEHVPIKKRRFLLRTPSPPPASPPQPVISSPPKEEAANHIKSQDAPKELGAKKCASSDINLSQITENNISNHEKESEKAHVKVGEDEDFSGISILAAAACSSSLGRDSSYAEDRSGVEECSTQGQGRETCSNAEERSSSRELLKEDFVNSSEMSTGGTSSCVSTEPVGELASISISGNSSQKVETLGKGINVASPRAGSLTLSWDVTCSKDEETSGNQRPSSRDERLHWDLNVVMDAWEHPLDGPETHDEPPHENSQDVAINHHDNNVSFQDHAAQHKMDTTAAEQKSLLPGKSTMVTDHILEGNYSNHDAGVCHNFSQPTSSDEKTPLSNCNNDPDLVKCAVDDSKHMGHHEPVHYTDGLVVTASDHASDPSGSGTLKEDEDATPQNMKSSGDGCHNVVGGNAASEVQEGYDSQYEDGELRETNECAWDEYYADREAEHVDYGQDDMEICETSPTHIYVSESENIHEKYIAGGVVVVTSSVSILENDGSGMPSGLVGDDGTHDVDDRIKSSHSVEEMTKAPKSKELVESTKSFSDMATGAVVDNGRDDATSSQADGGIIDSRVTETRTEYKAFRRGLRSQIEGPVAHDMSSREEHVPKMASRYEESSSMRSFERPRYPFHSQGRGGRHGDSWGGSFDGRRGFKRHYSPIFHGHSKLDADGIVERDEIRSADTQNDASYSHLPKNRSGTDEDTHTGFRSRYRPDRPATFGRGRSFRFGPSVDGRAGRGRYNGPSPDESFQSSLKYRRPLSRRERSLSPFGGRAQSNVQHSRGKSPSRSRSRSPIIWQPQRGRPGPGNGGHAFSRHRSRSPNFRSEARVQRLRSPNLQPGFGTDHAIGFRSFLRNHSSPPRRWTSARKDEVGHFREFGYKQRISALERSPGRNRMRGDGAGGTDSPRNLKPDGFYRISDRISEDSPGRGPRYEENYEDRRKHFTTLRPSRRSYEDGMASRLHQDVDDSFPSNNVRDRDPSCFQGRGLRGMDCCNSDMPRRLRGEQHSFMYERDGKFNSNSKQFGSNVMDSANNLQSDDQYQPSHPGRFPEMDGLNRGRRFGNYEDRRNHYGTVIRRSEIEGADNRMNHNVDENFQDAPDNRGRGMTMRNFDGRFGSVSMRLTEDQGAIVCGQEEKLDVNPQSITGQTSDDNDAAKANLAS